MKYAGPVIVITLVVAVILAVFLILPRYRELGSLKLELSQNRENLQNQQKYAAQLEATERQLEESKESVDKIDSALPSGPDIPSLLNFLQEASGSAGVELEGAAWLEEVSAKEQENVKEYSLGLSFSSSYFAFKNFLSALEKSARLINVSKIDFSVPQERNQPLPVQINMKVYSY